MRRYGIVAEWTEDDDGDRNWVTGTPDDLGDLIDPMMEALLERGAEDPAVSTFQSEGRVEVEVRVDANSLREAFDKAITIVGGAIIDVGGYVDSFEKDIPADELAIDEAYRLIEEAAAHFRWSFQQDDRSLTSA